MATIKELAEQAGMGNTLGCFWQCGDSDLERFAELIRDDERKRLNGVTAHEQQLIDGQASLMKVAK